jgi:hypothetical protein
MRNPVWLKAVCVVSIVLGSLGLLMATTGVVMTLLADRVQASTMKWMTTFQGAGGLPPEVSKIQQELMVETAAIQQRWLPINLLVLAVGVVVASLLLAGGIQALRMKSTGRKLLLAALATAAVFELGRVVPTTLMQWEISKLMGPYMQRIMEASSPKGVAMPPAQRKTVQTVMRSSMVAGALIGLTTALGMAVVKIAFYLGGVWLLRKPHIVAMYTPLDAVIGREDASG